MKHGKSKSMGKVMSRSNSVPGAARGGPASVAKGPRTPMSPSVVATPMSRKPPKM